MKKILLISLIIFLNSFNSVYSEEKDIILIPKNPNILDEEYSDEENNTKISNETIEVNELEINENDKIEIFNSEDLNSTNIDEENSYSDFDNAWINSSQKSINFLFNNLNDNIKSNAIKSSLVDVLYYGSKVPDGMDNAEFDKKRILKLQQLGEVEKAINLISNISTYDANKDIYDKTVLEKSLVDYNLAAVCGVLDSNAEFKTDSYLIKVKVFCSYLNGEVEEADFFNSLLLEENDDDYFQALYNKLIKIDNNLGNIEDYNYDQESLTLYSAIMRSENLPFSEDFIQIQSPQLLKSIAISPVTDISVRLKAAVKAYNLGSLNSDSIAALYQSVDFSIEELKNPLNSIRKNYINDNQKAMALLFQSSRIQILPISRLEALNNFWEFANQNSQSKLAYHLSKELLKSIEPTSELIDFAINTSKAHLYNNNIEEAKNWLKLIQARNNTAEQTFNNDYLQLVFLMSIHEGNFNIEDELYDNFLNSLDFENEDINNLELYLTTLEFIGFSIPEDLWEITSQKINDERKVPSIYIMKLLEKSANNNSIGELFLCIAVSIEENSWLEIHPQHLNIIFDNLKKVRKEEIINQITLEILEDMSS